MSEMGGRSSACRSGNWGLGRFPNAAFSETPSNDSTPGASVSLSVHATSLKI